MKLHEYILMRRASDRYKTPLRILKSITLKGNTYFITPYLHTDLKVTFSVKTNSSSAGAQIFLATMPSSNWMGFKDGNPATGGGNISVDATVQRDYSVVYDSHNITLTDVASGSTSSTPNASLSNYLHIASWDGTQYSSYVTIYNAIKFYTDSTSALIGDWIPVLNYQGIPCLWDRVSHTFFYALDSSGNIVTDLDYEEWGMTEVDYIRETGDGTVNAPYIDTGVTATLGYTYKMKIRHTFANNRLLTPMTVGISSANSPAISYYEGGPSWAVKRDGGWVNYGTFTSGTDYELEYSQSDFSVDGVSKGSGYGTTVSSGNVYLFGNIWNIAIPNTTSLDFYSAQILNGTELVRDYIPCVVSGEACMYDRCENKLYHNAGTGSFRAFITLNGVLYEVGSSIQTDGASYIDTGIVPNGTDKWEFEFRGKFGSVPSGGPFCMCGFMASGTTPRWLFATHNSKWLASPNTTTLSGDADTNEHIFASEIDLSLNEPTGKSYVDGSEIYIGTMSSPSTMITNIISMYMFARNNDSSVGAYAPSGSQMSYYKMRKNDVLMYDALPMMRVSDSAIGMYDFVNGELKTNAGSGTFTFNQCQASA